MRYFQPLFLQILVLALLWPSLTPILTAAAPTLTIEICTAYGLQTIPLEASKDTPDNQQNKKQCDYCLHSAASNGLFGGPKPFPVVFQAQTRNALPLSEIALGIRAPKQRHARAPPVNV